jgi:hypothetical protein
MTSFCFVAVVRPQLSIAKEAFLSSSSAEAFYRTTGLASGFQYTITNRGFPLAPAPFGVAFLHGGLSARGNSESRRTKGLCARPLETFAVAFLHGGLSTRVGSESSRKNNGSVWLSYFNSYADTFSQLAFLWEYLQYLRVGRWGEGINSSLQLS